ERGRDGGGRGKLADGEGGVGGGEAAPTALWPLGGLSGRRQLLTDHPQRQELISLQAQDRLQALDVVLAEEPIAALGPTRCEQALVLEVADLRDRDLGELLLQPPGDRADRQQPFARGGLGRRAHLLMKLSRYLPICNSSPLSSRTAESIRRRVAKLPVRLP